MTAETKAASLVRVIVRVESSPSRTTQTVTFAEPITLAEFNAWLEAKQWMGYHPDGYGPTRSSIAADGVTATYTHASSCD